MKALRYLLAALLLCTLSVGANAEKIFRFGPKVGTVVNSMRLNPDVFNSDNRAGFTGGLMMEANVPLIGLGFDLSVMYVHQVNANTYPLDTANQDFNMEQNLANSDNLRNRDYISIPLNIKYRFGLPVVGKIVAPYIYTGPCFGILASKKAINEAYRNKALDFSWNFGLGVQLFSHLQVSASYGLGINKTVEILKPSVNTTGITGRTNAWTITAAWLF